MSLDIWSVGESHNSQVSERASIAAGPATPAMFQQDGGVMFSRSGSQYQLHRPSHSSSGLSRLQSALRRTSASMRCASAPAGLTQPVAAHPRHEEVGETSLLHHRAAAVNHASSGSSSCETTTYAVACFFSCHLLCILA